MIFLAGQVDNGQLIHYVISVNLFSRSLPVTDWSISPDIQYVLPHKYQLEFQTNT